jgi:hypothetical protein
VRIIVIDEKNLPAISRLLGAKANSPQLEGLLELNPHVDFKKLVLETVLLLPDTVELDGAVSASMADGAFDALRTQMLSTVDAVESRLTQGYEALLAEEKAVAGALKSTAMKAALKVVPELERQIEAAAQVFRDDQQQFQAVQRTMRNLKELATAELDSLVKMLA